MSTVIDQPRNDVPIVSDTTLLAVPNANDEAGRAEYLKRIRALRNQPSAEVDSSGTTSSQPDTSVDTSSIEATADATEVPSQTPQSKRTRLSKDDLREYEIPVTDEDGSVQYLSYEDFEKTVGLYSKQNKRARELAEREREIDALKKTLVAENSQFLNQSAAAEQKLAERYQWVQNSLAFAHQHNVDVVRFEDGTEKSVTKLVAEKTALETQYTQLQQKRAEAAEKLQRAQADFIEKQNKILEERAPGVAKNRSEMVKFLEQQGFTSDEAKVLAHGKAELLLLVDKAMRYENAQRANVKEKKVGSNTKVLSNSSRLSGRGTPVFAPGSSRMAELQAKGTRASPDELRELRRLQLQNR